MTRPTCREHGPASSGPTWGQPIAQARDAAHSLVNKLAATDDFSLVTFSTDASVKVSDGPVGARRAEINKAIDDIHEGGGTNIGQGLQLAYTQAHARSVSADAVRVVLLVSDERANSGITERSRLSRLALDAFQDGVQTSTFGLGSDYDGALMSAVASDGAGGYYTVNGRKLSSLPPQRRKGDAMGAFTSDGVQNLELCGW